MRPKFTRLKRLARLPSGSLSVLAVLLPEGPTETMAGPDVGMTVSVQTINEFIVKAKVWKPV